MYAYVLTRNFISFRGNMENTIQETKTIDHKENDYGLVSIIMPNYNSKKYVEQTINSVISQTYQNWELLFVDDCSTDGSLEIVRSFGDERIKIFQNETNSGAAVSRNYALREAKGKWIAFLDSDDLWEPTKLSEQLAFMVENGYDFTCTHYSTLNENNNASSIFAPKKDVYTYKDILRHCYIGCLTVVYNAESLGKVDMPTNAEKREDLACWLRILKKGTNVVCLHKNLATYKIHQNSVSTNKLKMAKYQWNVYRKVERINCFKSLFYLACWAIKGILKYR